MGVTQARMHWQGVKGSRSESGLGMDVGTGGHGLRDGCRYRGSRVKGWMSVQGVTGEGRYPSTALSSLLFVHSFSEEYLAAILCICCMYVNKP